MLYTALEIIHSLGYIINEDISIKENPKYKTKPYKIGYRGCLSKVISNEPYY